MGLRSAAHICQRVTKAIRFMCFMMKIAILNYLDDFAGAGDPARAHKSFIELGQLLESCGIEESKQKAYPPSTRMTFIGVLFDSEELTLSVTPERLQEILRLLEVWLLKTEAILQELQSLIGKLSFISSCVQASRELCVGFCRGCVRYTVRSLFSRSPCLCAKIFYGGKPFTSVQSDFNDAVRGIS